MKQGESTTLWKIPDRYINTLVSHYIHKCSFSIHFNTMQSRLHIIFHARGLHSLVRSVDPQQDFQLGELAVLTLGSHSGQGNVCWVLLLVCSPRCTRTAVYNPWASFVSSSLLFGAQTHNTFYPCSPALPLLLLPPVYSTQAQGMLGEIIVQSDSGGGLLFGTRMGEGKCSNKVIVD